MRIRIRVLIPFVIFIVAANAERLTEKENEDRLKDCGKVKLPKSENTSDIAVDENAWIVRVHNERDPDTFGKIPGTPTFDSLGSFISRKHVVTSAQTLLTYDKKWSKDQKKSDESCDTAGHFEVPEQYAKHLEIHSEHCVGNASCVKKSFQAEKAWILKFCKQEKFGQLYAVLLIEVKESDVEFGCLANQYTKWAVGDSCHAYGISYEGEKPDAPNRLREVVSEIKGNDNEFVYLSKYWQNGDRGGPLVVESDNQSTIIGIGASPGLNDDTFNDTYFFNIQHYLIDFCFVAGICPPPKTTPAPTTTTEPTTVTTTTPTTTITATSIPTIQPPETMTSANPTTARPLPEIESSQKPDDSDGDKKEEIEEHVHSLGSGKMELNLIMFAAVLAMILVF